MNKNNILLTTLLVLLISGCASYGPKYRKGEAEKNFNYPEHKKIEKRFLLVGDAGKSPMGGASKGLQAVRKFADSIQTDSVYTVFLGDNIYPAGMPKKGDKDREISEHAIDAQLNAIKNLKGNILFIPGNHEWYQDGVSGVKEEANYVKKQTGNDKNWAPTPGCGLEIRDITDDITMIIIDSQWYLENWNKDPLINDDCPEHKTRKTFFTEIETEFKKDQNKTVIVAMHHPIASNGIHGGSYPFYRQIFPTTSSIPLPILGSLAMLARTSGGVSKQDLQNEQYKTLLKRLKVLARPYRRIVFASGHEHVLQYIEQDSVRQIVSGAGSKHSYADLRDDGLFAYSGQGFAVYDVFKDGSSWVSYYKADENNDPTLLYQKRVFKGPLHYDMSKLPDPSVYPDTIEASIYKPKKTKKGDVYTSIWGDHYRKLYGTKIKAPVAMLDTLYGGLTVMRHGGGHQTRSIRVHDTLDREYNIRALKKSAVQFIQSVAFKYQPVESKFQNTVASDVVQDFYTASHPYAFLAIPKLSDAIHLYHTNPKVIYMPKQKALGRYNYNYGNELYMIVERPEEHWMGTDIFGNPNHDIVSTRGMYKRLRRDEKYKLDETEYIKARIFDMLVGDWDRHGDQWRWAEFKKDNGDHVFRAIPRDRDQVFSNFDGAFFATLRGLTGFGKQFGTYGKDIPNVEWFNTEGEVLDRTLIRNKGEDTWVKEAEYIQKNITDKVIEEAFSQLPKATQGKSTEDLIEKLKGRRDNIVDITKRYYKKLAKLAILFATDKDDYLDVTRMPHGKTNVKIWRNKGGDREDLIADKTYNRDDTKEIWIYGLDDDDVFTVKGKGDHYIFLRLIGGQNNDIYKVDNPRNLKIYDFKSKPNTFKEADGAKLRLSDNYNQNIFDKYKRIFHTNTILPAVGYNPDDGVKLGLQDIFTINNFKRNPFSQQHKLRFGYYFATNSFDLEYNGQFANFIGNYNLAVDAHFTNPNFSRNFFGFGNETRNPEDDPGLTKDYNRVRISRIGGDLGLVRQSDYGSYFGYKVSFEGIKIEDTEGRFLNKKHPNEEGQFFERKYFAGLKGTYHYESYDNKLNPTSGMNFRVSLGGKMNTKATDRTFGYVNPLLEFYNSLTRNRKWVLRTEAQAQFNIGEKYEFYQAAQLGRDSGLRGYRRERFTGKTAFAGSADLRYSLTKFQTAFLPFQLGLFAGADVGRVWLKNNDSSQWHNDVGGGIWINSAEAVNGTFNLFAGKEGLQFSFGFGFKF